MPDDRKDDDLLFPRLRGQMKWSFIAVAVIFAVLFIVLTIWGQ